MTDKQKLEALWAEKIRPGFGHPSRRARIVAGDGDGFILEGGSSHPTVVEMEDRDKSRRRSWIRRLYTSVAHRHK